MANPDDGIAESDAPSQADVKSICGRRIDFQLERKPYNPVGKTSSFMLETLNPSASSSSSNLQPCSSFKKPDSLDLLENGLDPLFTSRITFRRIGAGLANLGNTCFLNSVLQCLTYTEPLAAYLQSGKHKNSCRMIGFCALCAIQSHVSHALQAPGRILVPKDLVSNLRCISRNFHNARQEDAHEYMIHLLESMHKCCLPSGVPTESSTAYEKSLVHKIFGGRLQSRVKCLQCFNCSDKFDPFLDLSLEILKTDSLNKALLHFTATEKLDGGEQQYLCEKCKQKVKALKQLTVDKAPYVLTIHLKRFGSHFSGQKIDRKVHFGPALDLKPFVSGSYVDGDLRYTLYGVLVHAGGSTHSGHYYCFVRTSSGMWYSLDDNEVEGSRIDLSVSVKSTKIPNLNGTVTAASSHQILGRKLKHKKCKSTAMHFGPNMMYRASYSIRKRKKGKKKKVIGHNLAVERLLDDGCTSAESAPSTSERTSSISLGGVVHSFSRSVSGSRKTKKGADEQLKERIDHGNDVLGADLQSLKSTDSTLEPNLLDNWKLVSLKDSLNCQVQTGKESIVALDLETAAVGQWDGVELTSSKNLESNGSRGISIGYVADEWDEEYDRGRRKKVRRTNISFGGSNPFQKIATKKAKLNMERKRLWKIQSYMHGSSSFVAV